MRKINLKKMAVLTISLVAFVAAINFTGCAKKTEEAVPADTTMTAPAVDTAAVPAADTTATPAQ